MGDLEEGLLNWSTSLAHKAGKYFKEFNRPRPEVAEIITKSNNFDLRPIMKSQPDLQKLARTFVSLADHHLHGDDCNSNIRSS